MKFSNLAIPEQIIKAQDEGKLAIFAGAGISMADPANLPSFSKLVTKICDDSSFSSSEPLERVLGRYHDAGVNVHSQVKALFDQYMNPKGDFTTELHIQIPRLFRRGDLSAIRIVTTNFDTYLSRTVPEAVKRYSAPALPLGGEFSGLVYLHGSIDDESTMVLTDRDFARAYITQGWAREFLLNLYDRYTVLFIGYSHEDQLVSYLARGMNLRDKKIFAFSGDSEEDMARWNHLGITPIPFPRRNYSALEEGVAKWADEVQSNFFSRSKRFNKILQFGVSSPDSENDGFLKKYLMTPGITEDFYRKAQSADWCSWVVDSGLGDFIHDEVVIEDNFSFAHPWRGSKFHLGLWLARNFVRDVRELNRALKRYGHGLSWPLTQTLVSAINREEISSETDFGYLCTLLITECSHVVVRNYFTGLLGECTKRGFYRAALLVLRELLKPRVGMDFYHPDSQDDPSTDIKYFELDFTGNMLLEYSLENDGGFVEQCSREIFDICISALNSIEEMNRGAMTRIPYSWLEVRSVDHAEDSSHTPVAAVCHLAVMCMEQLLNSGLIQNPLGFATYLADSQSPFVRRVAIHLVMKVPVCGHEKALWLRDSDLVFRYQEYHEVFLLIADILSDVDEAGVESFLDFLNDTYAIKTKETVGETDAFLLDYYVHLAYYLSVNFPESTSIQEFYRKAKGSTDYSVSRPSSPEYPTEGQETVEFFKAEFQSRTLSELIQMASSLSISLKADYVHELMILIEKDAKKALDALEILSEADGTPDINVSRAVLGSLAVRHTLTQSDYERYLRLLDTGKFFSPFYITEMLSVYRRARHRKLDYEKLLIELKVCRSFWENERSGTLIDSPYPILEEDTALALFASVLCRIVEESQDTELTSISLQFLEEILDSKEEYLLPLYRGLGESLFRLFATEKSWTKTYLIPLFSPSHSGNDVAQALWEGYFRIADDRSEEMDLLEPALIESCKAGLLPSDSWNFSQALLKRLCSNHSKELEEALVSASDDKGLAMAVLHIKRRDEMKTDFKDYWNSWVRSYFESRLGQKGKPLGPREFAEILLYAVRDPLVYEDLSGLLKTYSGKFMKRTVDFVEACKESGFHLKSPSVASQYLAEMVPTIDEMAKTGNGNAHRTGKVVLGFVEEVLHENPDEFDSLLPVLEHYGMAGVPEARLIYEKYTAMKECESSDDK